ncbi:sialin-like isoform X2 [Ischnura elegans]|uniref:sialin-like isoform X2 n=1 Tax=Ischnura elegans TaxID=197161 RepID=UPI001ED88A48|nr:sialin-like isoform X2 [Ischnura elegans]XP_046394211.1 sialin-like isoform X2 [Ischnura elegans]
MAFQWHMYPRKVLEKIKQRYVLAVMGFFAIGNAYSMRVCLSVAIVEMVAKSESSINNSSFLTTSTCEEYGDEFIYEKPEHNKSREFSWDEETQGIILSSFFWGYVLTQVPGGMLAEKIGGKHLVGFGIFITSILTLLTPAAAHLGGSTAVIALRVLEGLGEGVTYPAMNYMLASWVPPNERSVLGTIVYSGSQIGTVFGMALSGNVIEKFGWESVFYLFGALGIIFYLFWLLLCYDDPSQHPFAMEEEIEYLEEHLGTKRRPKPISTPWRAILTSVPLWGLVFAQIGHDWGFYTLLNDLPKYMGDVLHFNISMNGYLSALPYLAMWAVSILSSWLADCLLTKGYLSTTNVRRIFSTTASLGPAVGLLAASYMSECQRGAIVTVLTLGVGAMGTFYPGMKVNSLDLSPNYAGTLMGITNGAGNVSGILSPYIIGLITTKHTPEEWKTVFFISIAILIVTNIIFVATVSGETQAWNENDVNSMATIKGLSSDKTPLEYGSIENSGED